MQSSSPSALLGHAPPRLVRAVELLIRLFRLTKRRASDYVRTRVELEDIRCIVEFVYNIIRGAIQSTEKQRKALERIGGIVRKLISKRQLATLKAKRDLFLRHLTRFVSILHGSHRTRSFQRPAAATDRR